ncbi:glycosyltransferase family 4 protein [Nakamurella deserti]|uniref:glycosyltransferase family 4 protein n=1 Tax=Nakamurella deserti TaxID=2164074 RepID=UPI000DBEA352|nr:glycosyltransferase family 1 protein [Nakamurella deserti]
MPTLTVIAEQILAPVPGGTGRYARQILQALAQTSPAGWTVRSTTAWHRDTGRAVVPGVDGPHRQPAGPRALAQLWRHGLPPWPAGDRVHATTPLAPAPRRGRTVVTVHDTVPWTHPETLTPRGVAWHRTMIDRAARTADRIVVPTRTVADELAALFPRAADRIVVVGHGVTALPGADDPDARAAALGVPARYVLSLATVEPRKGLDVLVAAMAGVDADLVVVGQAGWGEVDLRRWADAAGLDRRRLHLLGRLPDADLGVVLDRAAVLAVPSRAEGFGLPVLEGMAAGIPVVHSDAPALVEVGGDATLSFPRDDADALADRLRTVLDDRPTAADLATRGRLRAAGYRWTDAATALWRLHTA